MSVTSGAATSELAQVVELVDDLAGPLGGTLSDERPAEVAAARKRLADAGLWTAGVAEEHGGGGDPTVAAAVIRRLAHHSAALAWGCAQAHAAAIVLAGSPRWAGLLARVHAGEAAVAVTDLASTASRLASVAAAQGRPAFRGGSPGAGTSHTDILDEGALDGSTPAVAAVTASFGRIDGCAPQPWVVALDRPGRAWVLPPEVTRFEPLRHTGLDGACTGRVTVPDPVPAAECLADGANTVAALTVLRLGAAAAALGIAVAAAGMALRYCAARHQFGGPLTDLATVREALYLTARDAEVIHVDSLSPGGPSPAGPSPVGTAPARAAALADAACEAAIRATAGAVQLHGGYGYLHEYGAERLLRDALSLRAACDAARCRREGASALVIGRSRGLG